GRGARRVHARSRQARVPAEPIDDPLRAPLVDVGEHHVLVVIAASSDGRERRADATGTDDQDPHACVSFGSGSAPRLLAACGLARGYRTEMSGERRREPGSAGYRRGSVARAIFAPAPKNFSTIAKRSFSKSTRSISGFS